MTIARLLLVAWMFLGGPVADAADRHSAAEMLREPWIAGVSVSSVSLSPDGRFVAGIEHGRFQRAFLLEVDTSEVTTLVASQPDRRYLFGQVPISVKWIGNDLLAVDHNNRESISVDRQGRKVADLGEYVINRLAAEGPLAEHVLAYRDVEDGDIALVNARTGERQPYRIGLPGKPVQWVFDAAGVMRSVTLREDGLRVKTPRITNWYRSGPQSPWVMLESWPLTSNEVWWPLRVLDEPDTLAILSRHQRDTEAVFRYDVATRRHLDIMAEHPREDIVHVSGLDTGMLERVTTAGLKGRTSWFDARWAGVQASVDAALPGRRNLLSGNKRGRVLVHSYGDVDPGRWFVLDTTNGRMQEVAIAMPGVKPEAMRPMETFEYPARDGLAIPAYLTRPAGEAPGPRPMVVVIHGGPNVRDAWEWNEDVQLFARSGWVVFQPQFRGSSGFGRRFEEAGYRQWGRAMQDDITDGVRHLIERGIADPKRICIYGASYGGYAAMWGLIKTPELYRCGVSLAGISDLRDQLNSGGLWDDSTRASRAIVRARVGDPETDGPALDEVSPLRHAERVRAPLLIAHGNQDRRVQFSQSREMVRALESAGKPVDWMPIDGQGHDLGGILARSRYYARVMNFLEQHLGLPDANAAETPASGAAPR